MMLIGNYGGHMAFTTEPPYCVAYAVDYQDNDPSKMMPHKTLNHPYAMVTNNMMVRRLLSVLNWDPSERKRTKGGHLLIPRGMQFGPKLFPEIVIPRNHAGLLVDSAMRQDAPLQTIGPFQAVDTIFPSFPGDLELFTAEEVAQLKELGVLDPQPVFECPPLFTPLVPLTRGKVVSAVLGAPPPEIKADSIRQSLTMDWDEESILSDSYSDRHSITADSSIVWGRYLGRSSEQKPQTTECPDKESYRSSDKDCNRNHDRECPKRETSSMVQNGPANALHDAKTMTVSTAVLTSANVCAGTRALSMTAKQSRGTGPVLVHCAVTEGRTPPNVDLCCLHPCRILHR